MENISLTNTIQTNVTVLPNEFIDRYMIKADGEYVKIFLLILRLASTGQLVTIDRLADTLELTRKDVSRALRYWEKEGLLGDSKENTKDAASDSSYPEIAPAGQSYTATTPAGQSYTATTPAGQSYTATTPAGQNYTATAPTDQSYTERQASTPVPKKHNRTPIDISQLTSSGDMNQTTFMLQTYIGKPLSSNDLNTLCYIQEELGFSSDLLDYLIEYCVNRGKKSMHYIESVAIAWYQDHIDTIEKAKAQSASYTLNVFPIMKAFGLNGRNPAPSELDYITQWNDMGFETDLIVEACNRSIKATHQPSFQYANTILTNWFTAGVKNKKDVEKLDQQFQVKGGKNTSYQTNQGESRPIKVPKPNSFHNFEQDSYDYDEITAKLLAKNRRP